MEQVFVDKMTEGTRELGIRVVGEADGAVLPLL